MKIVQVLPTMDFGDAIGNDVLALRNQIISMGFKTDIYATNISPNISRRYVVHPVSPFPNLQHDDVLIYHLSTGSSIHNDLYRAECRKIVVYHNITPPEYFKPYDLKAFSNCQDGLEEVKQLSNVFDYGLADSTFNKDELINHGFVCPIDVLPILIPFDDYEKKPSNKILRYYNDDKVNILFLGRVAPNKKHADIIAAFSLYKKYYNKNARLFIVGGYDESDYYYQHLQKYISKIEVNDVIFTGKVPFDEILAYYRLADVFLCMSEHEGFCVPLIEAMCFNIPIIAYSSSAIPETLNGSGILLKDKDTLLTAGIINRVINDGDLREKIIANQKKRLKDFSSEVVSNKFKEYLNNFLQRHK